MDELRQELVRIGLSEKEAAVYLAALERGSASVQDIARIAGVNRATTYLMIDSLASRGLMSMSMHGKKRVYAAEAPERLASLVHRERQALNEREQGLLDALPRLAALFHAPGVKPCVRYIESMEGLETARGLFENLKGDFFQIVPYTPIATLPELAKNRPRHLQALVDQHIQARVLFVRDPAVLPEIPVPPGFEHRVLSTKDSPMRTEMSVRADHIFFYFHENETPRSLLLASQEIADAMRWLFDAAWEKAVPQKQEAAQP